MKSHKWAEMNLSMQIVVFQYNHLATMDHSVQMTDRANTRIQNSDAFHIKTPTEHSYKV